MIIQLFSFSPQRRRLFYFKHELIEMKIYPTNVITNIMNTYVQHKWPAYMQLYPKTLFSEVLSSIAMPNRLIALNHRMVNPWNRHPKQAYKEVIDKIKYKFFKENLFIHGMLITRSLIRGFYSIMQLTMDVFIYPCWTNLSHASKMDPSSLADYKWHTAKF